MTLSSHPPLTHRAELDALDCVLGLLEASRHRDGAAYRQRLHDDLIVRVNGELAALGADAGLAIERERWAALGEQHVEVDDVNVSLPNVYVRFAVHAPHDEQLPPTVTAVGYSIYEVSGDHLLAASHYIRTLDAATVHVADQVEIVPTPEAARDRRVAKALAFPVIGALWWLGQEVVLAAPVVAATARFGGLRTFGVLALVYFVVAYATATLTLHLLRGRDEARPGRARAYLERATDHGLGVRLLRVGGVLGFIAGSYLLSAAPTVWTLHRLGLRRRLPLLAVLSSAIWAAGFVGFYCGAATLLGL